MYRISVNYLFTMLILKQDLTGNLRLLSYALPDTLYSVSQPLLPTRHSALHAPHTTFHPLHTGTNTPLNLILPVLGFHSTATVQPEPHRCNEAHSTSTLMKGIVELTSFVSL